MRIWNGFSYAEIAAAMGVREATARSNMHDALITIRRHLEPRM
jgi:DNA-directed RNA polymerase specialized sigma24 family protein